MTDTSVTARPRLELSGVQVVGGALAATTSAVAASSLGVAGTLAGAALGSAVATVGGALYTYSLRRTSVTVLTAVRRDAAGAPPVPVPAPPPVPVLVPRRPRGRLAPLAAGAAVFALALGGVSAAELVAGEPLSTVVTGTRASSSTTLGSVVTAPEPTVAVPDVTPVATPSPAAGTDGSTTGGGSAAEPETATDVPTTGATPGDGAGGDVAEGSAGASTGTASPTPSTAPTPPVTESAGGASGSVSTDGLTG